MKRVTWVHCENRKRKCQFTLSLLPQKVSLFKSFCKCIDSIKFNLITNSFTYFFPAHPDLLNKPILIAENQTKFHHSRDSQGHIYMTLIIIVDLDRSKSAQIINYITILQEYSTFIVWMGRSVCITSSVPQILFHTTSNKSSNKTE